MESAKPEKYHATWVYVCILLILITLAVVSLYFIDHPLYRFGLAALPLLLLLAAKNSVVEVHAEYFFIKNYFLLVVVRKHRYLYDEVAFVHYHRHAYFLGSAFDFWGFYRQKPLEIRYKNKTYETLPVYGVRATILKGVQAINDRIYETAGLAPGAIE